MWCCFFSSRRRHTIGALVTGVQTCALPILWPRDRLPPLVSSFERASLTAARRVAPHWPRGLLAECFSADWREALVELGCAPLHPDWRRTRGAEDRKSVVAGKSVSASVDPAGRRITQNNTTNKMKTLK